MIDWSDMRSIRKPTLRHNSTFQRTLIMKIYIVQADNHDYDYMSEWFGDFAYLTEAEAEVEADRLRKEYWKENPGSKKQGFPNVGVLSFEVKTNDS